MPDIQQVYLNQGRSSVVCNKNYSGMSLHNMWKPKLNSELAPIHVACSQAQDCVALEHTTRAPVTPGVVMPS